MLILLPTDVMTENASQWLTSQAVAHRLIALPQRLCGESGASKGIFLDSRDNMDVPMRLSRARFVVMRVFREFDAEPEVQ
ncbi:MAG: hypothetical protein IPK79_04540 [Vampirovibrionales bacterium]|nr:hypothetical protein [Vampirovibrionales bacterium]